MKAMWKSVRNMLAIGTVLTILMSICSGCYSVGNILLEGLYGAGDESMENVESSQFETETQPWENAWDTTEDDEYETIGQTPDISYNDDYTLNIQEPTENSQQDYKANGDYAGRVDNGVYSNPSFDFIFTPESLWTFASEEELLLTNNFVSEFADSMGLLDQSIDDGKQTTVMFASNENGDSVNVTVSKNAVIAYAVAADNDSYIQLMAPQLSAQYQELGFEDVEVEVQTVMFRGENRVVISTCIPAFGSYMKQISLASGAYYCTITAMSSNEATVDQILTWFDNYRV